MTASFIQIRLTIESTDAIDKVEKHSTSLSSLGCDAQYTIITMEQIEDENETTWNATAATAAAWQRMTE